MTGKLAAGIRQVKPFASLEEEALLNLSRTHEFLQQRLAGFFRQYQLTPTQYDILRILRQAGAEGLTCSQASGRMAAADPDITRLFDRLEARRLMARTRSTSDRRVVVGRITKDGLALLNRVHQPLEQFIERQLGRPGKRNLKTLIGILKSLREA